MEMTSEVVLVLRRGSCVHSSLGGGTLFSALRAWKVYYVTGYGRGA